MKLLKTLSLLALTALLFTACKKDKGDDPGTNVNTPGTYQPITTGSTWKYSASLVKDSTTHTITGKTQTFGGKTYSEVEAKSKTYGTSYAYYSIKDHVYTLKADLDGSGQTLYFTYLNDTAKVNYTWTANVTDGGTINSVPARIVGKILQKGVSKSVNGKTYNDVIHTSLDLQYNIGGFTSFATYDFYAAKGIGLIEIDASSFGFQVSSTKLVSYQIK